MLFHSGTVSRCTLNNNKNSCAIMWYYWVIRLRVMLGTDLLFYLYVIPHKSAPVCIVVKWGKEMGLFMRRMKKNTVTPTQNKSKK